MNAGRLIIYVSTFGSVACLTAALLRMAEERRRLHRLRSLIRGNGGSDREAKAGGFPEALIGHILAPLGRIAAPRDPEELARVSRTIRRAGHRSGRHSAVRLYYGVRALAALLAGALYVLTTAAAGGIGAKTALHAFVPLAVGYYLPAAILRQQAAARSEKIMKELPDALDLLKICIEAGLSLDSGLHRVSRELRDIAPILSKELAQYFLEIQSGLPRRQVLGNLAERNQVNSLSGVVNVFIQSSRLGTDIAEALRVYSTSLRTERRQVAEELGAKVAVKLTLPMILLILPALLIVILGPAMISMFERLGVAF
jgi:tight adherence protein C